MNKQQKYNSYIEAAERCGRSAIAGLAPSPRPRAIGVVTAESFEPRDEHVSLLVDSYYNTYVTKAVFSIYAVCDDGQTRRVWSQTTGSFADDPRSLRDEMLQRLSLDGKKEYLLLSDGRLVDERD